MEDSQYATYPSLKTRVVLITGGATGIGASVVARFARQGSRVTFLDVQDEAAQQLVDSLASEGCPKPIYIHCDITDLGALKAAVDQVLATHATVDVLVNNAANDQRHSIEEVTPDFWEHSLATI
jgi:NAD(P)-dependent dehydrogenase (short-subunit alcohol dehydrogenase family)